MKVTIVTREPMTVIGDYFKGFEGEPEITFIRVAADQSKSSIHMWIGYFVQIMEALSPKDNWEGLVVGYQLHAAWYDDPWEIPKEEMPLALKQIKKSRALQTDETIISLCDDLIKMLAAALDNNEKIIIEYS